MGTHVVANSTIVAYIDSMPKLRHYDHLNTARFVTFSCYRRLPLLTSDLVIQTVVDELAAVRTRHLFRLLGYVIMPEHVHLVIHPRPESKLGLVIAEFKSRSAARIIAAVKTHLKGGAPSPHGPRPRCLVCENSLTARAGGSIFQLTRYVMRP